jgi:hypothetical protein
MANDDQNKSAPPKRMIRLRKEQVRHLNDDELEDAVGGRLSVIRPPDSVAECDISVSACSVFCK